MVKQFTIELNRNYKLNDVPSVSAAEVQLVAHEALAKINKLCSDKRTHRLGPKKESLVAAYGFNNQLDFYKPNPDRFDDEVANDDFMTAFTEMEEIRKDLQCTRFLAKTKLITVFLQH
jgi:hypothetical protein